MKKVAIFGGTGFVGHYLVEAALAQGWQPRVLVRPGNESRLVRADECITVEGDISDTGAIEQTLAGADAAIYNIGILRQFPARGILFEELHHRAPERVMQACSKTGVERFILMSANGVKPDGVTYQRTKYAAEQCLRQTDLQWTIFRPSVLFGNPHGRMEFATQLLGDVIRSPLPAPLFFPGLQINRSGKLQMAPAHVEDIARAFALALDTPDTIGETICLCGPENLEWKQILERIAQACGRKKIMLPAPTGPVSILATLLDRYPWFPLTAEQITMLMEGNTCSEDGFTQLGISPHHFDDASLAYLKSG